METLIHAIYYLLTQQTDARITPSEWLAIHNATGILYELLATY